MSTEVRSHTYFSLPDSVGKFLHSYFFRSTRGTWFCFCACETLLFKQNAVELTKVQSERTIVWIFFFIMGLRYIGIVWRQSRIWSCIFWPNVYIRSVDRRPGRIEKIFYLLPGLYLTKPPLHWYSVAYFKALILTGGQDWWSWVNFSGVSKSAAFENTNFSNIFILQHFLPSTSPRKYWSVDLKFWMSSGYLCWWE